MAAAVMQATNGTTELPTFHNVRRVEGFRYGAIASRSDRTSSAPHPCAPETGAAELICTGL